LIDFYNDDIYIELKSRRNTYQKYNTAIIGSNKIDYVKALMSNRSGPECPGAPEWKRPGAPNAFARTSLALCHSQN